ncbi:GNAT family N-acetyltransferase [Notoacmeibacter marinus]|uniref:GNAT family N-acetyltransferase n=1 Tax=Notoacmeibacter marinus TaxID=1876515 RepID=UPI000B8BCB72|nr:N-acetyltransferase [Notoacmeibacter marinus]
MSFTPSPSQSSNIRFTQETSADDADIEALHDEVFGPGRFVRAASAIREQGPHDRALSFTARFDDELIGSVRLSPISVGPARGHLLGPLAVLRNRRKAGIGKHLVNLGVEAARVAGSPFVLLVGDAPYYWPMGFRPISAETVRMPLPVAPDRLLVCALDTAVCERLEGNVRHAYCIEPV